METKEYTMFQIAMGQIFHELRGSTTHNLEEQSWWKHINDLRGLAQNELLHELLDWAGVQQRKQLEQDTPFTLQKKIIQSIWGQVISKIESIIKTNE